MDVTAGAHAARKRVCCAATSASARSHRTRGRMMGAAIRSACVSPPRRAIVTKGRNAEAQPGTGFAVQHGKNFTGAVEPPVRMPELSGQSAPARGFASNDTALDWFCIQTNDGDGNARNELDSGARMCLHGVFELARQERVPAYRGVRPCRLVLIGRTKPWRPGQDRLLKASALRSRRRKSTPCQSAMSMLNFYLNRAGHNLPKPRLKPLQKAKASRRAAFERKP